MSNELLRERLQKREQEMYGDIYDECEKRGCDINFCKSFDTRIRFYPLRQTEIFIEFVREPEKHINIVNNFKKWKIYLEVYIELRPNDEKSDERKQALGIIDEYLKSN